jgi:hypothetical protein
MFSGLYLFSVLVVHVCYYCGIKFDNITGEVEHCQGKHQHNVLKYRQLIHDEHSAKDPDIFHKNPIFVPGFLS